MKLRDLVLTAALSLFSLSAFATSVTIYCQEGCGPCEQAMHQLDSNAVMYKEKDINSNSQYGEEFRRLGGRGTPLIIIGNDRIEGYDHDQLQSLINKYHLGMSPDRRMDHKRDHS